MTIIKPEIRKVQNGGMKETEEININDDKVERGNWSGRFEFLLSCLGYAVGLGNVWRFPYLCFKNGGGSFLVPYFLMLAVIGIPAFLLELHIGQYSAMGPAIAYSHLSPLFKGLGFANIFAHSFIAVYYNVIISWTIYYLIASFTADLPWQHCHNDYNDHNCFSFAEYKKCEALRLERTSAGIENNIIYLDRSCIEEPVVLESVRAKKKFWYGGEVKLQENPQLKVKCMYTNTTYCDTSENAGDTITELFDIPVKLRKSSSAQYFSRNVLDEGDSIEPHNFTSISGGLFLSLLAAWIIVFLCCVKGIKSSGKVVYFTAVFPYVVLAVLLVRAVTLEGASQGIHFYLVPKWSKLGDIRVWEAAAVQIFFSLSIGGGGLITLSSYNKFHNNLLLDTVIVCVGNCMTSFVAGFAIFSVLGFMAAELGVDVQDVAKGGTGLAFEAYPDLVTRLPLPTLWAILFFLMLFTLGLDSQFAIVETICTGILDYWPSLRPMKTMVVGGVCLLGFCLGLPFCCPGGSYLLDLLDYYAASWPFLFIAFMEFIIIVYVYGYSNYIDDLFEMTRSSIVYRMEKFMSLFYSYISPLVVFIVLLASWISYQPLTKGDYTYPTWANGVGWIIALTSILSVPAVGCVVIFFGCINSNYTSVLEMCGRMMYHTVEWRENAVNTNVEDGDESEFDYVLVEEKWIRQSKGQGGATNKSYGQAPLPKIKKGGFANIFKKDISKQHLMKEMF